MNTANPEVSHATDTMRDIIHWLPVRQWIHFELCYIVRNCVVSTAPADPAYLQEVCVAVKEVVQHQRLRSATDGDLCRLCVPRVTDLAGEPLLHSCGTSCRSPHELPAPTRQTVSSEHWRRSWLVQLVASCCRWQQLWETAKTITLTLTLTT